MRSWRALAVVGLAAVLGVAAPAAGHGPGGAGWRTGEDGCAEAGRGRRGLCRAFCTALDCPGEPGEAQRVCRVLRSLWERRTAPGTPFPCEACTADADCGDDRFCRFAPGSCGGAGVCRARPQLCPELFAPVCGCDGLTYENACAARAAGASIHHPGECCPEPSAFDAAEGGCVPAGSPGACLVTGCSSQVCAEEPVFTTCEWRPEYACYAGARCEPQPHGRCGWTPTDELRRCLEDARSR